MVFRLAIVFGTSLLFIAIANGQQKSVILAPAKKIVPVKLKAGKTGETKGAKKAEPGKTELAKPDAAKTEAKPPEPPKVSPRLQKLQQAQYDRRPSTILLNWSKKFDAVEIIKEREKGKANSNATAGSNLAVADRQADLAALAARPVGSITIAQPMVTKTSAPAVTKTATAPAVTKTATNVPSTTTTKSAAPSTEKKIEDTKADDKPKEPDPIDVEILILQHKVALGDWAAVKAYFAKIPEDEGKAGFQQMLQVLVNTPQGPPIPAPAGFQAPPQPRPSPFAEKNSFLLDDILGLTSASPKALEEKHIALLGTILTQALGQGVVVEEVVKRFEEESKKPAKEAIITARQAAQLLFAANQELFVSKFLPKVEEAVAKNDLEALNMLAKYAIALGSKDSRIEHLEEAWKITQAVLAVKEGDVKEKEDALLRAVELAPKIREQFGQAWLDSSFTSEIERGKEILSTIGTLTHRGFQVYPHDTNTRLKTLELQKAAVDAMLKAAPKQAADWKPTLTLLATAWFKEAEFSHSRDQSTSYGPRMQRDVYGNIFFLNDASGQRPFYGNNPNMPAPISVGDVLRVRPQNAWLKNIDENLLPKLDVIAAKLFLKVNEEDEAWPAIERTAKHFPEQGKQLVDDYLQVWIRNHDPNASRRYTNPYYYMYGFERRAEGIPLTRSKQERNLTELSELIKKLKTLPCGEPKEELIARAFTTCHSSAEVYRIEAIQKVFGPLESIKPRTLANLVQGMRGNLMGIWKMPATQQKAGTKRKQKDIEAEVMRGYDVALKVVENSLVKFPKDWSLNLAKAAILHDLANYSRELAKSSEFSAKRTEALALFKKAAQFYCEVAPSLREDEISTEAFDLWFYASLGACDLGEIKEDTVADSKQPPMIKSMIDGLPGELAEKHRARFANQLFNRMSSVSPGAKYRYLNAGFSIVGDHKAAEEARKVADYYRDLNTEIKLDVVVDGEPTVAEGKPFGVFVNLRHTREIERESGGFSKYLQNQNSSSGYYYNYGRPLADYRDRFQESVNGALGEQFEILSVTFQDEKVNSRATEQYGWRITPYAYLLLKPKGKQVDRIAPLKMDLDFLDTSGYVVLPIESPTVPLSVVSGRAVSRPMTDVRITQTLDERQAKDGKLVLEIKATANGLVDDLDNLLELPASGFVKSKIDDNGVSVTKFAAEAEGNTVVSDRTWTITLEAPPGKKAPMSFAFGTPIVETKESIFQRYDDADLAPAEAVVSLESEYGKEGFRWQNAIAIGAVGLLILFALLGVVLSRPKHTHTSQELPENLTPFAVAGLLRQKRQTGRLTDSQMRDLDADLLSLEHKYFAAESNGESNGVDLRGIATRWINAGSNGAQKH